MTPRHFLAVSLFIGLTLAARHAGADTYYPSFAGPYYWNSQYMTAGGVKMMPSHSHVCVLTEIGGNFRGTGERIAVRVYGDGYWYLEGTAKQSIWGSADCFSRSLFQGEHNWLSDEFTASADFDCWLGPLCNRLLPAEGRTDMWWGDAASFVNGISGKFNGYDESVSTWQHSDSFTSAFLQVTTHATSIWGLAYSYFVGVAHSGHRPWFIDASGTRSHDSWHSLQGRQGEWDITQMAPTKMAMCYFTEITGSLRGSNFVSIEKGVEHWILKLNAPDGSLAVNSRCFAFDQR